MSPGAETERRLMAEVGAGSVDAFAELYDRFSARAYRVAYAVCRDQGHAQDAVQDAFLAVWRSRRTYRAQQGTVAAWLLTVVRRRAIDVMRRNGSHVALRAPEDRLDSQPAPDDVSHTVVQRDDAARLRASLDRLPEEQREVITLAYYGQLTHTEIATRLDLPEGTVKGRMRLGLRKLGASVERAAA